MRGTSQAGWNASAGDGLSSAIVSLHDTTARCELGFPQRRPTVFNCLVTAVERH
ncbi:hypothetical protein [Streptomyces sp. NPDC001604]|uniref:hypothetical protein n=1 Tax=Streptomyces sp. NPDC001604 TaxID=3364593 RepID=UPI00369051A6